MSWRRVLARTSGFDRNHFNSRWLLLRGLGLVLFAAFASIGWQASGLMGPTGIAPATQQLASFREHLGWLAFVVHPTLLWVSAKNDVLTAHAVVGLSCAVLITANIHPRWALATAAVVLASFANAAPLFSDSDSLDGLTIEATILGALVAPAGARPGLGRHDPPPTALWFLPLWLWFRLYLESGVAKLRSGGWLDAHVLDRYFETVPAPTWFGYQLQQLPHAAHVATTFTIFAETIVPIVALLVPRTRVYAFVIATLLQIGIVATGNFGYLNHLSIVLGFPLLADGPLKRLRLAIRPGYALRSPRQWLHPVLAAGLVALSLPIPQFTRARRVFARYGVCNDFAFFASIPRGHSQIEVEGSTDGETWIVYPLRWAPQRVDERPRTFAPYYPRLDLALWVCGFGRKIDDCPIAPGLAHGLLRGEPAVLSLFRSNPFPLGQPHFIRFARYEYRFIDAPGLWWVRKRVETVGDVFAN